MLNLNRLQTIGVLITLVILLLLLLLLIWLLARSTVTVFTPVVGISVAQALVRAIPTA